MNTITIEDLTLPGATKPAAEPMPNDDACAVFTSERYALESALEGAGITLDSVSADSPALLRNIFNFFQYAQDITTQVEAYILDAVTDVLALHYQHECPTGELIAVAEDLADGVDDVHQGAIHVRGRVFEKTADGWVALLPVYPADDDDFSHRESDVGPASLPRIKRYALPAYCQTAMNYVAENF